MISRNQNLQLSYKKKMKSTDLYNNIKLLLQAGRFSVKYARMLTAIYRLSAEIIAQWRIELQKYAKLLQDLQMKQKNMCRSPCT